MAGTSQTAIGTERLAKTGRFAGWLGAKFVGLRGLFARSFETEAALRRLFLWLPVAAGTGVVLYLCADREPSLWLIAPATVLLGVLAFLARGNRVTFFFFVDYAPSLPANCRRRCGRHGSRRQFLTGSGLRRSKALSRKWIFAAMARASSCGPIPPLGFRLNRLPFACASRYVARRLSRPEPM